MGHVSSRAVKPEMLLLRRVILAYRGGEIVSKHVSSVAKVQFHAGAPIKMLSELSGLACPPPGLALFRDKSFSETILLPGPDVQDILSCSAPIMKTCYSSIPPAPPTRS